jgi:hypothetical protein
VIRPYCEFNQNTCEVYSYVKTARISKMEWKRARVTEKRMIFLVVIFNVILEAQMINSQQTQATYNVSLALESLTDAILLSQVTSLTSVISSTPLTATTVQVDSCLAGSFSPVDAQTCTLCSIGKYSETVTATSINTCIPCSAGKYQNITGASSVSQCINCPVNTYFTGTNGGDLSVCEKCPAFSYSFQGSQLLASCVCLPGYSGPNG